MRRLIISVIAVNLFLVTSASPSQTPKLTRGAGKTGVTKSGVIWRQPSDIDTRNLFYGPGGQAGQPRGPFRFIKEDRDGGSPKFVVKDSRGVEWKAKIGDEAKPETAATRLLWAAGYFTDVNYYLSRMRVAGMPKLSRGQKYVSTDGTVHGARLERTIKKVDDWSWFENPFVGTKEFNGLRVMMALMNKWDLKQSNNAVYQPSGGELRYFVSDLGDTFGKTGGNFIRSKGNLEDYLESKFVDEVKSNEVDLVLHSRPLPLYAVAVPYYVKRVKMEKVSEEIPRAHARWIGQTLARLSNGQISDAFRAAGYGPREVDAYARKVRERIRVLNEL